MDKWLSRRSVLTKCTALSTVQYIAISTLQTTGADCDYDWFLQNIYLFMFFFWGGGGGWGVGGEGFGGGEEG